MPQRTIRFSFPGSPQIIPEPSHTMEGTCRILSMFGDGTVEYIVDWRYRLNNSTRSDECAVTIRLKGYRTIGATLRNDAVIVLKRIGDSEGLMVSMTVLKAPEPAKKAFGKGVAAMIDQKWAAAQKNFERATQRRMEDAASITEQALALNPIEFPAVYFYDASANFNLNRFDLAEKSVRRAIELDSTHELPRAEFLLGSVLAAKGDRNGALQHMRKYLELSPKARDTAEVNRIIAKIESGPGEDK